MIYKDTVNILKDALSRFEGVNYVKYQGDDLNNQQHNYKTIQAYIDDVSFHQFNITTDIVKAEYQIYILGHPDNNDEILDVQDKCYNVAINVLAYIDQKSELKGLVRLYDYSILTLSRYTAQNNAGVKLSVILEIPNRVCDLDKFGEPYEETDEIKIDLPSSPDGEITLNPVKLPRKLC